MLLETAQPSSGRLFLSKTESLPVAGAWNWRICKVPSDPNPSVVLWKHRRGWGAHWGGEDVPHPASLNATYWGLTSNSIQGRLFLLGFALRCSVPTFISLKKVSFQDSNPPKSVVLHRLGFSPAACTLSVLEQQQWLGFEM